MQVKIAELDEINSVDDASNAFHKWLKTYIDACGGGSYVVDEVDIIRQPDGWVAEMKNPPRLVEEEG